MDININNYCIPVVFQSRPPIARGNFSILDCDKHIVSNDVVSYVLILGSYIGGLLIFRFLEPEHLSSLSETVS